MAQDTMPKYFTLMHWIRDQVAEGALQLGDKLPSEKELGERFSISRQTVRQATSVLENEGILERRRGSGTYIRSVLTEQPKGKTMNIGVVTTYLDDYIFPGIIKGIENVLTQHGYIMQLNITHNKIENETRILENVLQNGVDGLIIEPTKSGLPNLNTEIYKSLRHRGIPYLFINGYYPAMHSPYIAMDDYACGKAAAEYLLAKNHTRIAGIFKSDDIQGHLRYAGCAKALQKQSLLFWDDSLLWFTTEDLEEDVQESFEKRVLSRIRDCTAVVCYNDQIAMRLLCILEKHQKRVPQDFSVVGFDNADLSIGIGLTTFQHPKEELGRLAAEHILAMIQRQDFEASYKFPPVFVERSSVRLV